VPRRRLTQLKHTQIKSLGQKIKAAFVPSTTLVVSNGNVGYIPDAAAYQSGYYEVLSMRFASGAGERLSDRVIQLLQEELGGTETSGLDDEKVT